MLPAQRFGREYLTYTLWAISPEGGVHNIAEIVPEPSNKATVRVSTDLQAFGLIVTAEPYSATRYPSNVVVLENRVRPDTEGQIEQVQAKYELMPRGQYTWHEPTQFGSAASNEPKVSMDRYEEILEIYEAQNAIGIAQTANAANAQQARARAEEEKERAQAETEAAQIRADVEHAARERTEADAAASRERAVQAEASAWTVLIQPRVTVVAPAQDTRKSDLRMGLLDQLNGVVSVRDTARGLVATIPDSDFSGAELRPSLSGQIARIAALVEAHPGLNIVVEGNTDSSATEALASERAESVRRVFIAQGLPAGSVTARGLGDTHLFGPNSTAAGREANRRVEVIISGAPIGDLPFWDHPYALTPESR